MTSLGIDLGDHLDQFVELPARGEQDGVRICFRDLPPAADVDPMPLPLVLITGLSLEQSFWPAPLLDFLAQRGWRVITLDNRDSGRSTRFDARAKASKLDQLRAKAPQDAYTLEDMGADVLGVLDHLGIETFHLAGMSMGGMIGQVVASTVPDRVASFTSIFSTTGHPKLGQPAKATLVRMAARAPRDEVEHVAAHLAMSKYLAGPGYPPDVEVEVAQALRNWRRGVGPRNGLGVVHQISAIQASGDRTDSLLRITAPTLVIHGDDDPMVHTSGGEATHHSIPGSRLIIVPGMGHHFGPGLDVLIAETVDEFAREADAARELVHSSASGQGSDLSQSE